MSLLSHSWGSKGYGELAATLRALAPTKAGKARRDKREYLK